MALQELLKEINALQQQLEEVKPLKSEDEERLWKKFRLEWNYNSNHIEGNTLTYGQTELLLMFDKITGDHEVRELEEMKAHDAVIHLIRDYAKDKDREITESDIRQWNKTILVRPFWSDAQTQSGQPTKKLITPGEYKKQPNSVLLTNGEMFHYATPEETPALVQELIEWYRKETLEGKIHPVELAALMHYKFVRIHPFDDSNGRTARLLMNYVLLKNNYPPVIIKSADKKNYLFALNKADTGDLSSFVEYISHEELWSLNLNINAAKGLSVEEIGDIDKDIFVWKKQFKAKSHNEPGKTVDLVLDQYINSIIKIYELYIKKHEEHFKELFMFTSLQVFADNAGTELKDYYLELGRFFENVFADYKTDRNFFSLGKNTWTLTFSYRSLKTDITNDLFITSTLQVDFYPTRFEVIHNKKNITQTPYSRHLSDNEISNIVNISIKEVFELIKNYK